MDWNDSLYRETGCYFVTSLAEVWIEIFVKSAWGWEYESLPLRKCGLKYWAVLHMGIRGVSAIIINIIKTYWNPWICLIFIFTSWEIPMQPFCWRIVLIQKVFRICRTCQGNYIRRCLWRYTGNYRRLSGRTGTIYWRSYSKREERSVLWLFGSDWNRLNPGGIFQRSMIKNRIVVREKSTNKNRTFVLFSCVNLYTFKNLFDIIGTVTRTNSKNMTEPEPGIIRYFRVLFYSQKSVLWLLFVTRWKRHLFTIKMSFSLRIRIRIFGW